HRRRFQEGRRTSSTTCERRIADEDAGGIDGRRGGAPTKRARSRSQVGGRQQTRAPTSVRDTQTAAAMALTTCYPGRWSSEKDGPPQPHTARLGFANHFSGHTGGRMRITSAAFVAVFSLCIG